MTDNTHKRSSRISRPRRMRSDEFSRRLMRESVISVDDLIYPMFIIEGKNQQTAIDSMPGIVRLTIDLLIKEAKELINLGIPAIALFPVVSEGKRSDHAAESWNPTGLVQTAVRELKSHYPDLGVITDVALDPYTLSGQDGLTDENGYEIGRASCRERV